MKPFSFRGLTFNADEETSGAFTCFDPSREEATDRGPNGMVAEMTAFLRIAKGMGYLLDVGALFGVFSLAFTAMNRGATAYAIEASPWAFPILKRQCEGNPDLKILPVEAFVGDTRGRAVSCTRDWMHVEANLLPGEREQIILNEQTIDGIGLGRCDVMKIDVEAYECQVLRGASATIDKYGPILMIEVHMENLKDNGETAAGLMALFDQLGYRMDYLDGSPVLELGETSMTHIVGRPA